MKKIIGFLTLFCCVLTAVPCVADDEEEYDEFDSDEFLVVDSDEVDVIADSVELNPDAAPAMVSSFDIADIMLGMHFEDVETLFYKNTGLYTPRKKNSIVYTIPQDWKYNLDYECRQQGVYVPDKLDKCIKTLARNRGLLYAAEVHLVRENTGETIVVYFTSNATDNVVWRVVYENDVDDLEGDNPKFADQRDKKILAFWQRVLDKYGAPNSGSDKWVTSGNAYEPMLIAYYGSLELLDRGIEATDAAKNVQQSRENFHAKPYAF